MGGKIKNEELGEKMKRGKEKGMKIVIKNGGKVLRNASFWVINSKNFRGWSFDPPPPC